MYIHHIYTCLYNDVLLVTGWLPLAPPAVATAGFGSMPSSSLECCRGAASLNAEACVIKTVWTPFWAPEVFFEHCLETPSATP